MWAAALLSANLLPGLAFLERHAASSARAGDTDPADPPAPSPWRLLPLWLLGSFLVVDQTLAYTAVDAATAPAVGPPEPPSEAVRLCHLVVAVTYAVFLLSSLVSFSLSYAFMGFFSARRAATLATSLAIESMMVITYGQMWAGIGSSRAVMPTWWGGAFSAARLNLWCHSSMTQLVVYASSPPVTAAHGVRSIHAKLRRVYAMFAAGLLSTLPPPSLGHAALDASWVAGWLLVGASLFLSVVCFVKSVLPLAIAPVDTFGDARVDGVRARLVSGWSSIILATWTSFPAIWALAASHSISPVVEDVLYALADGLAKGFTSLILHYGAAAVEDWQAHATSLHTLHSKDAMLSALKQFTQSIGHDLRTPLQALVFCNIRAQNALAELQHTGEAGGEAADGGEAAAALSDAHSAALSRAKRHLDEVDASAELLTCVVSNLWDFERITNPAVKDVAMVEQPHQIDVNETVDGLVKLLRMSPVSKR